MTLREIFETFDITKEELCMRVSPKENEILFLSGSQFDGLGNSRSDLDIFVISDDSNPLLKGERNIDLNIIVKSKRFDISIFAKSLITEASIILRMLDFSNPELYVPRQLHPQLSNYEMCTILHRIKVGVAITNEWEFKQITSNFPFKQYIDWLYRLKLNQYDGLYEDLIGSLESRDLLTAETLASEMLRLIAQLLILSSGETFDREKWIPRKLLQVVNKGLLSKEVFEEYIVSKNCLSRGEDIDILNVVTFCENQIEKMQLK